MRTISFEEADPHLNWTMIADAIEAGHALEKAHVGDLLLQSGPNALLNRGAWIDGLGMALKSMSVFPANAGLPNPMPSIHGGVFLFEDVTGRLEAVVDGILVTKWKTAGDSVLGARLLANREPKTHLMVGAGTVAASIIKAYREVFPSIERFVIWNRTEARAQKLGESLCDLVSGVEVANDLAEACGQADIITTATMSVEPVVKGEWIKPGTHLDLIGAFKPDMREADDAVICKAKVFVDSRETTIGHIGEITIPLKKGVLSEQEILGDLYDLCARKSGRTSPLDITLYKNGGGAHLDLMTSFQILKALSS